MTPGIRSVNVRASNLVITTNTVLATLGLAVPCGAGSRHHIRWWVPFTEAAGVAGIKAEIIAPAAITSFLMTFFITNLVPTHVATDNAGLQTAAAAFTGTGANAGNYLMVVEAELINGVNAGSFDLQVAQGVSDAGALTLLAGAYVEDVLF
jgi:hypothetical protein